MDRETFFLRRDEIQMRMENRRKSISLQFGRRYTNGASQAIPNISNILKEVVFKNALLKTVLTTVGVQLVRHFMPKPLRNIFPHSASRFTSWFS